MTGNDTLLRILQFIRSIGIEVNEGAMVRKTLVPGIDIISGTLLIDATLMCQPADLLHEAAHIALTIPSKRPALDGMTETSAAEEISAIAWTWAASQHLDIDPAQTFDDEVISGNGPTLRQNFLEGHFIGVPMLEYWGMTVDPSKANGHGVHPYPHMLRWLRTGHCGQIPEPARAEHLRMEPNSIWMEHGSRSMISHLEKRSQQNQFPFVWNRS